MKVENRTVGFTGLINIALIVLKLCDVIKWSWLVLIPIICIIAVFPWILRILFIYWIRK